MLNETRRCCWLAWVCLLGHGWLAAQTCGAVRYDWRTGLAGRVFADALQDRQGALWVGSFIHGANRFDGRRWEHWSTKNGLLSNQVSRLFEDAAGGLWFDHNEHGLSRWNEGRWQHFNFGDSSATVPRGQMLCDAAGGTVRIVESGFYHHGASMRVYRYHVDRRHFEFEAQMPALPALCAPYDQFSLAADARSGVYWVVAVDSDTRRRRLLQVSGDRVRALPEWPGHGPHVPVIITANDAAIALPPALGEVLAWDNEVLCRLHEGRWRPIPPPDIPGPPPRRLIGAAGNPDGRGFFAVWQLDDDRQHERFFLLAEYAAATLQPRCVLIFRSASLHTENRVCVYPDRAGTLWVSTPGEVLRLFPNQLLIPASTAGMPAEPWAAAEGPDGQVWFASFGDGLAAFDGRTLRPAPPPLDQINYFLDGCVRDADGRMLFNIQNSSDRQFSGGILAFDGHRSFDVLAPGVHGFYLDYDKKGRLLWGTSGKGLWIRQAGTSGRDTADWLKIDKSRGLRLANVVTALEDRYGRYWMGRTSQGLACYDPLSGNALNWLKSDDPANCGVISMAEDARGNLWFGTDQGLMFLPNQPGQLPAKLAAQLRSVGADITGTSLVTACRLYDPHTLVLGNSRGVFLLNLDSFYATPGRVLLRELAPDNGYAAGPVNQNGVYPDAAGRLWILGQNGAVRYDPDALERDTATTVVYIDSLLTSGQHFLPRPGLRLGSDVRFVRVYFHAPPNPYLYNNVRFEYRLDGTDTTWTRVEGPALELFFPNLKAGHYQLQVRAVKEGIAGPATVVDFRISPVWWQHPVFWLALAAVIGCVVAFFWQKEAKIAQHKLALERSHVAVERVEREKDRWQVQAIALQLNPHFINNVLQWIQVRVHDNAEAAAVVARLSRNIGHVFRSTLQRRYHHRLHEELYFTENYLFIQQRRMQERLRYTLPPPDQVAAFGNCHVPLMLIQIHVENAVEHGLGNSLAGGYVAVALRETPDYMIITVEDNGVGRKEARRIGSGGTQQGTRMLRALIAIYNRQNALPLRQHYEDDIFTPLTGAPHGTRVVLEVPKTYIFNL